MIASGSSYPGLIKRLNPSQWACCPCCKEEWTRLEATKFWFENSKARVAYVCPPCAHSVMSIPWFVSTFNIFFDNGFKFIHFGYGQYAQLSNGYRIIPSGERVKLYASGEVKSYENIPQAMIAAMESPVKDKTKLDVW